MKYILPIIFIALVGTIAAFRLDSGNNNFETEATSVGASANSIEGLRSFTAGVVVDEISAGHDATGSAAQSAEASSFVAYAKTLIGTPYLYGSADPSKGLDCSGFVNAVSDHFGIDVPRSSADFTNFGNDVQSIHAAPGDLILFTGTNPASSVVGHIGIITENHNGELAFIHSSSGKAKGVTISGLDDYYKTRFVKVIRILPNA